MAIGPGIYFNEYKDYSVDELERELEDLQKYLSSDELKKARQEEIDKQIDDNNCIENVRTEISVIEELLKNKKTTGFELNEKEKIRCPKCYSILKEYIYGKIKGEIDTNKYIAGGCELSEDNPIYHCSKCNYDYDKNLNLMTETLEKVIESFIGNDPFWKDLLKEYFNKLTNISEEEKISFLKKLASNKNLFNEFTKEILKELNIEKNQAAPQVNLIGNLLGCYAWVFFAEGEDGMVRVELRSSGFPIQPVAVYFGGGGHLQASGCVLEDINKYQQVIDKIKENYRSYKNED